MSSKKYPHSNVKVSTSDIRIGVPMLTVNCVIKINKMSPFNHAQTYLCSLFLRRNNRFIERATDVMSSLYGQSAFEQLNTSTTVIALDKPCRDRNNRHFVWAPLVK